MGWVAGLRYVGQILTWVSTILVMRLLSPNVFGLMAEASVALGFLMMMSELGLGVAIIQFREVTIEDLRKLCGFVFIVNIMLAALLWMGAPLLAAYFGELELVSLYRALSMVFFLMCFYIIPQSIIQRNMEFKKKAIIEFSGAIVASGLTLLLAWWGFEVWSLIVGAISMHVVWAITYPFAARLYIHPVFSFRELGRFVSFGGLVTSQRILWYLYSKADIFIGGRFLDAKALGAYSVALTLSSLPLDKISPIVNQIALPAYSNIQDDLNRVRHAFLKSVRMMSLTCFPVSGILFFLASDLIDLFLGVKWHEVALPMQILSLVIPIRILSTLFSPLLIGLGRADIGLLNVFTAFIVMIVSFFWASQSGIIGLCFAWLVGFSIAFAIMCLWSLRTIGIKATKFLQAFGVPFLASIISVFAGYAYKYFLDGLMHQYMTVTVSCVIFLGMYFIIILVLDASRIYELSGLMARWRR
jgi:O-antigen/teichoic acid export membrane protein